MWRQPYGFERCAAGAAGWRARAEAWDFLLAQRRRERRRGKTSGEAAREATREEDDGVVVEQVGRGGDQSGSSGPKLKWGEPPRVEL